MGAQVTDAKRYLRFADLQAQGIVGNRETLRRWQLDHGFPRPVRLGPNTAVYDAAEVEAWLATRTQQRKAS
jgi:predicted DNA-binding transcriptional regulator AlpA